MEEKAIYEFEGTELKKELDEWAEGSDWGDEIFISPKSEILRVQADQSELFRMQQNLEEKGWIKVLWGQELRD